MPGHDVFLCYDPATGERFARRFGTLLARFGRRMFGPGPHRPTLRVALGRDGRDRADALPADADRARTLTDSAWLVLLASPEAARSPQVTDDVTRWLDEHGADRLLIGLTRGADLDWSDDRPAPGTDTLPPVLLARLTTEPKWVDLRDIAQLDRLDSGNSLVRESLATFAARLRDVEKDELIGEHVKRERFARRATFAAVIALVVGFGITFGFGVVAFVENGRADAEADEADARLLAATALAVADTDAERAVLLAAEGYRLHHDTQTFTALLRSVEATGPLERRVDLGSDVVSLAAAPVPDDDTDDDADTDLGAEPGPDAETVVAGTADGEVWRWRLDQDPERLVTLDGPVTEVAVSADGETVAAVADSGLWVSTAAAAVRPAVAGLTGVVDVAVDPEGQRLALVTWDDTAHDLLLLDVRDGARVSAADLSGTQLEAAALTADVVVVTQRRVPSGTGHWQRRTVPGLELVREAGVVEPLDGEFTEHQVSPDGAWVTAFRAGSVFAADTKGNVRYEMAAPDPLGTLLPVTAAPSGDEAGRMLLSRRGETWVVELPVWTNQRAWQLRGMPTADTAAFIDDDRLVTAHGSSVAAWDLDAASPLTHSVEIDRAYLTDTALAPDEASIATGGTALLGESDRTYDTVWTYPAPGADGQVLRPTFRAVVPGRIGDRLIPLPLGGGRVLVVTPEDGTVSEATGDLTGDDLTTTVPLHPLEARYESGLRSVRAARTVGDRIVLADAYGRVQVRDALTGRLVHHATATHAPTSEAWAVGAAISPDGRHVAFHDISPLAFTAEEATISVLDMSSTRTRTLTIPVRQYVTHLGLRTAAPVVALTYGDDSLLVSQADGVLVVEPDGSAINTEIDTTVGSTAAYTPSVLAPVPGTSLVAQAGELDWIQLYDTQTGERVGSLTPPDAGGSLDPLWLGAGPDSLLALSAYDAVRWDLRPEALVAGACAFAARDLTVAEWARTVGTAAPDDLACDRDL